MFGVQCSVTSKSQILSITDRRHAPVCLSWSLFVGFSSSWTFFLSSLFVNYFCLDLCWRLKLNSHCRRDVTRPSGRVVIRLNRFDLSRSVFWVANELTAAADGFGRKFGNWTRLEFIQLSWVELNWVESACERTHRLSWLSSHFCNQWDKSRTWILRTRSRLLTGAFTLPTQRDGLVASAV